jgi:hypothetical protein
VRFLRRFFIRLSNFTAGRRADQRLQDKRAEHLAFQTDENLRAGMSPAEARRQAALKLGAAEAIREDHHAEQGAAVSGDPHAGPAVRGLHAGEIFPSSPASPPCSLPSPSPPVASLRCAPCASIQSLRSDQADRWHWTREVKVPQTRLNGANRIATLNQRTVTGARIGPVLTA